MTLAAGDLTTLANVQAWMPNSASGPNPLMTQLITRCSAIIHSHLNRASLYSQVFTRTFDGVGNNQLVLPDYPVTSVVSVQLGSRLIPQSPLPTPNTSIVPLGTVAYGWRVIPWTGNLPGEPATMEFNNGYFWRGNQNVKIVYTAGYLVGSEVQTIPATSPWQITVNQAQGTWCRDGGVVYVSSGTALSPVETLTAAGQYIPPSDSSPGLYTFFTADEGQDVLISYSFIPADLEEACIQLVAERLSYRGRIGELDKTLGGQETIRFLRGGIGRNQMFDLPPEIEMMIWPYVSVIPPLIGAPV